MNTIRRTIHPEVRVLDSAEGICEYRASDETLDYANEVILASGWRFDNFQKNAPFVNAHQYGSIDQLLGKVIDYRVQKKQLIETVKWATDVPECALAQLGWKLTQGGYLKAVSVGFYPTRVLTRWDANTADIWDQQIAELGLDPKNPPRCIYQEQQQLELSACVVGMNPNAVALAYKDGVLNDFDLDRIAALCDGTAQLANAPAGANCAWRRGQGRLGGTRYWPGMTRAEFLQEFERACRTW